jgi:hypothetical protein
MQRQLLQKPPRPFRPPASQHIVQRIQPLPRLQHFNAVSRLCVCLLRLLLLRLSHADLTP